jgi:hypothetical protein
MFHIAEWERKIIIRVMWELRVLHYHCFKYFNTTGTRKDFYFIFFAARHPQWAHTSSLSRLDDHTREHHTRYDSSGRVIGPSQRPLPDNTQHSQETDVYAPDGIRTHYPNKLAAAGPRLWPRDHWDLEIFNTESNLSCSRIYYTHLCTVTNDVKSLVPHSNTQFSPWK